MSKPASTTSRSVKKSLKPPAAAQSSTAPPKTSSPLMPTGQAPLAQPQPKATQKVAKRKVVGGRFEF